MILVQGKINRPMESSSTEIDAHIYENLPYNRAGITDHEERIDFSVNDAYCYCLFISKTKKTNWIPTLSHTHRSQSQMN